MLENISYYQVFGAPLIAWLGIATLLSLVTTAATPFLNKRGIHVIPFDWLGRMTVATITLALIHGTLGILAYF